MKCASFLGALALACGALAAGPLVEGKAGSPVRVVIYEDLQCSDCAAFRRMLDEKLLPKYGDRVAFEHRDFPLAKHSWAKQAAIVSQHFQESGPESALQFRRAIMGDIQAVNEAGFESWLIGYAHKRGLDPQQVLDSLSSGDYARLVEKDFQDGVARGVAKTPTAFVNGAPFIETFTFEEISKAIDTALAESKP
jgi:protein-disulfide isomerase